VVGVFLSLVAAELLLQELDRWQKGDGVVGSENSYWDVLLVVSSGVETMGGYCCLVDLFQVGVHLDLWADF